MSELKAYIGPHPTDHTLTEYYLKSEADKVIAELKRKNNEVETELELWRDGSIISEEHQKELDGKRHSDYKRCLAMAKWCKFYADSLRVKRNQCRYDEVEIAETYYIRCRRYRRWCKIWMELADKYKDKEAK